MGCMCACLDLAIIDYLFIFIDTYVELSKLPTVMSFINALCA